MLKFLVFYFWEGAVWVYHGSKLDFVWILWCLDRQLTRFGGFYGGWTWIYGVWMGKVIIFVEFMVFW